MISVWVPTSRLESFFVPVGGGLHIKDIHILYNNLALSIWNEESIKMISLGVE